MKPLLTNKILITRNNRQNVVKIFKEQRLLLFLLWPGGDMWYCKKLFQLVIKDPLVWASYIILAVVLTIPLFLNADVYGMSYARSYETGNEYDSLCKKAGTYPKDSRASEEFLDISRQIDLLGDVNISVIPSNFFEKYGLYHEYMLQRFDSGKAAQDQYTYYAAHGALSGKLSKLDRASFYDSEGKLPALHAISETLHYTPDYIRFLPALIVSFVIGHSVQRERLFGEKGFISFRHLLDQICVASVLTATLSILAFLPLFAATYIRNDIGNPTYPVVLVQANRIIELTALECVIWSLSLMTLANVFLATFTLSLNALVRNEFVSVFLGIALVYAAKIPFMPGEHQYLRGWLEYLPVGFFDTTKVVGYVGDTSFGFPKTPIALLDPLGGLCVLISWTFGTYLMDCLILEFKRACTVLGYERRTNHA